MLKKEDFQQAFFAAHELAKGIEVMADCRRAEADGLHCFDAERRRAREKSERARFTGERPIFCFEVRNMCHRCQTLWHAKMIAISLRDLAAVEQVTLEVGRG